MTKSIDIQGAGNFTIREVAEYLRVHRRTIMRALADKRLGCLRIGRRVRIPAADLRAFINGCRAL